MIFDTMQLFPGKPEPMKRPKKKETTNKKTEKKPNVVPEYVSTIAHFHNQKEPNFNPDTGIEYLPGSKQYDLYIKWKEEVSRLEEIGSKKELYDNIKNTENIINNLQLKNEVKNDKLQEQLLQEVKLNLINSIQTVYSSIDQYMDSIHAFDRFSFESKGKDIDDAQWEKISKLNDARTEAHNDLLKKVRNSINLIKKTIDDNETKESSLLVQPVRLNKNVFIPDNIDLDNREQIMKWAFQVYDARTKKEPSI